MTSRRALALAVPAALIAAAPASAHGIGGRGDLPIPKDYYVWAAAIAVAVSFAWVALGWQRPVLRAQAAGRPLPGWTTGVAHWTGPILRVLAFEFFAVVLISAWAGRDDSAENLAPVALYVVLWVVVLWASALVGGIWRSLNPWDSIAALWSRGGRTPDPHPPDGGLVWSHWPAAVGLAAFIWLELAYHDPASPRAVAVYLTAYSVAILAMAAVFGRRWIQTGEGFTVLFGLVAAIAPIGRRPDGRLTLRVPFTGLAEIAPRSGTLAVILVVLGGTTFDGVTRTPWWGEIIRLSEGWERTLRNTLGLAATIAAVAVAYWLAAALSARLSGDAGIRATAWRYAPSLVPIALAYSVAHYFSLVVFEGQTAYRLLSDPLGRGWDLFGTAGHQIDYLALTTGTIAGVVTLAMVVGHVAGVVVAHDRAVEVLSGRRAALAQLPIAAAMIAFTVVGLTLLLSV